MKEPKAIFKIQQKMLLKNTITEMKYSTGRLGSGGGGGIQKLPEKAEKKRHRTQK